MKIHPACLPAHAHVCAGLSVQSSPDFAHRCIRRDDDPNPTRHRLSHGGRCTRHGELAEHDDAAQMRMILHGASRRLGNLAVVRIPTPRPKIVERPIHEVATQRIPLRCSSFGTEGFTRVREGECVNAEANG